MNIMRRQITKIGSILFIFWGRILAVPDALPLYTQGEAETNLGVSPSTRGLFLVKVTDREGKSLLGVEVTIEGSGKKTTLTTGKEGRIALSNLNPGDYILSVEADEFFPEWEKFTMGENTLEMAIILNPFENTSPKKARELPQVWVKGDSIYDDELQKRSSLTIFDKNRLIELGVRHLQDLSPMIPNFEPVHYDGAAISGNFSIRGIIPLRSDPVVGFYLDGIEQLNDAQPNILVSVDRIAVLRGPQITYGTAPLGGVVEIETAKPKNTVKVYLSGSWGRWNTMRYEGGISIPLVSNTAFLQLGGYYEGVDGYFRNTSLGRRDGGHRDYGLNSEFRFYKGYFSMILGFRYTDRSEENKIFNLLSRVDRENPYFVEHNAPNEAVKKNFSSFANFRFAFRGVILMSATRIQMLDRDEIADYDFRFFDALVNTIDEEHLSFSQDILMRSDDNLDKILTWKIGIYYAYLHKRQHHRLVFGEEISTLLRGNPGVFEADDFDRYQGNASDHSFALYGETSYGISKKLFFTIGGRVDYFRKQIEFNRTLERKSLPEITGSEHFNRRGEYPCFSPKLGVAYQASWSTFFFNVTWAFRPGGLNLLVSEPIDIEYQSERLIHYEIGAKMALFRKLWRTHLTGFYLQWEDIQLFTFRRPQTFELVIANAGRARSGGFEMENTIGGKIFQMEVNVGYVRAEFLSGSGKPVGDILSLSPDQVPTTPLRGNRLPFSSEWNLATAIQFRLPFRIFKYAFLSLLRLEYQYRTPIYYSELNLNRSGPRNLLNLKATLDSQYGAFSMFFNNLLNETYRSYVFEAAGENPDFTYAFLAEPFTFGVSLTAKY